ncbi:MAG: GCN5-related N-acetyltransferase [Candidatus Solibacter sp.]|nr:GCN5-related N-acetyltransferase [Candidatus Solibacter sp.]
MRLDDNIGMSEIPVIETERLRLRGHRVEDFRNCAAMWGDPVVTRYIGGRPFTAEEVWARLLRYVGHWTLLGFGFWLIEERATGSFVGEAGLAEFQREMEPSIAGVPEMGWVLSPRFHGKGYGTEVVRAICRWGEERFGGGRMVCIIDGENAASMRVAEKCGFRELPGATYRGQEVKLFERVGEIGDAGRATMGVG